MLFQKTKFRTLSCVRAVPTLLVILLSLLVATSATAQQPAKFIYPQNGDNAVDTSRSFKWHAVAKAQAYALTIGTTYDGRDLFNSDAITTTEATIPLLIEVIPLYARLGDKLSGKWYYTHITFQVSHGRAKLISPAKGALVTPPYTFKWTTAKGAQAYSLKIGTASGLRDIYNGVETQESVLKLNITLPENTTLYARIYTKANEKWVFTETEFITPELPVFMYPQDKSKDVDIETPFQWKENRNADAYYLKLGTALNEKDIFYSGVTSKTSLLIPPLPAGITIYALLQERINGTWLNKNITFKVKNGKAVLLSPKDGEDSYPSTARFRWSTMRGALAYVLLIGTAKGERDLYNSGERLQDRVLPTTLPVETLLHATIATKHRNGWAYSYSTFMLSPVPVRFSAPSASGMYLTVGSKISWQQFSSITSYRLYLGTSLGARDYLDTGEITGNNYTCPQLPIGVPIYARIRAKWNGHWYDSDTTFYVHTSFLNPPVGAMDVETSHTLSWLPGGIVNGIPPKYRLSLGTSREGHELLAPRTLSKPSFSLKSVPLPNGVPIYATVKTVMSDGTLYYATTVFATVATPRKPVSLVYPTDGQQNVDVSNPFMWKETDLASGYQLQILSNGTVVSDSGEIHIPSYFASDLPLGDYTAILSVKIAGEWLEKTSSFHVSKTGANVNKEMQSAIWATDRVRKMGLGYAFQYTPLWQDVVAVGRRAIPVCTQYATTLLALEQEMNIGRAMDADKQPRLLIVSFISNGYDGHTLTEYYHRGLQRWVVLDPTFGLVPLRTSDSTYASKEDIQASTLAQDWSAISYKFLGGYGNSYAQGYYIDYPLLYLNIPNPKLATLGNGNDPLSYLQLMSSPPQGSWTLFLITSPEASVDLTINGVLRKIDVLGVKHTSNIIGARNVTNDSGANVTFYKLLRFVF